MQWSLTPKGRKVSGPYLLEIFIKDINNIIHLTIFGMQCMYKFFPDCIFIENMPLISLYLKTSFNIENNHSLWESFGSYG